METLNNIDNLKWSAWVLTTIAKPWNLHKDWKKVIDSYCIKTVLVKYDLFASFGLYLNTNILPIRPLFSYSVTFGYIIIRVVVISWTLNILKHNCLAWWRMCFCFSDYLQIKKMLVRTITGEAMFCQTVSTVTGSMARGSFL